jgi:hypothetical protein
MAGRAICRNCDREMAIMQDGMCGGCFGRTKDLEGSEKLIALAKARTDFMGKGPRCVGNRAPRKPKVERRTKKDPASGAIASAGGQNIGVKVEGTAPGHDVSDSVSTRKPDRKLKEQSLADYIESEQISARITAINSLLPPQNADNPSIISIMVNFTDNDQALFDGLTALSRKFRRSPDQQILWMLEQGIDYFNKNLSGEEVAP